MKRDSSDTVEWHICETPTAEAHGADREAIHMGPFASEEQCRMVLDSLKQMPPFSHSTLEVQKKCRRREKRVRMKLPVQVSRLSAPESAWPAYTVDVSSMGARLAHCAEPMQLGEFLEIRCGQRAAVFRVVWVGLAGTPMAGQFGTECLTREINIWDLDLSARTDDEPLLREIAIARAVQRRLLPREKPALQTLDYSGKCIQANTVGGDYYDFLDLGAGRVGFVLADVAGKGVPAALLMANLQGSIHQCAGVHPGDLPGMLAAVNDHLFRHTEPDRYATLFFGCYDDRSRSLGYVNCGHTPPLLLRRSGAVDRLDATGMVLGLLQTWDGALAETRLEPNDLLTIYTDGVTETTDSAGQEFGDARLLDILQQSKNLDPAGVLSEVEKALEQFRPTERLHDDLTLVVARGR